MNQTGTAPSQSAEKESEPRPLLVGALAASLLKRQARISPEKLELSLLMAEDVSLGGNTNFHIKYEGAVGVPLIDIEFDLQEGEKGVPKLMGSLELMPGLNLYENEIVMGEDMPAMIRTKALAGYYTGQHLSALIGTRVGSHDPVMREPKTITVLAEDLIYLEVDEQMIDWKILKPELESIRDQHLQSRTGQRSQAQ